MSSSSTYACPRCGAVVGNDLTHCGTCGAPQVRDDPPDAWIGRTIDDKYAIEGVLGVGGMGMVFAARRVLVGDVVALKVLFPRFLESPLQRRLFRDEAVAAARLSHPNVVTVFDAELQPHDGSAYIVMELLKGDTFKTTLRDYAPLEPLVALPIMMQVCTGLAAAHAAQIIHRDLKPDNVFMEQRPDGSVRVKLVDFGIAAMLDADNSDEQRRLLGTLRYMAPEQCRGEPVDPRADLYALGVMLYETLTRRRATGKTVSAVLSDEVKPPNLVLPEDRRIPHALEDLVMHLLAKHPDDRPSSAIRVRERMEALCAQLRGEVEPAASEDAPPTDAATSPRRALWIGLALACAVGIAGGLAWGLMAP